MITRVVMAPLLRLSLGLVLLTISILLIGDFFFTVGSQGTTAILDARKKLCESLATQTSVLISAQDTAGVEATLNTLVRRNPDVLSAGLRRTDGTIIVESGVHDRYWVDVPSDQSTPTHAQVPIFDGNKRWGTVEVRFTSLRKKGWGAVWSKPFTRLMIFFTVMGFVGYLWFMKRSLKHLDPGAVIPGRVKTALDVLAEGVVLIDDRLDIVLVNKAFNSITERSAESLLGTQLSDIRWKRQDKRVAKEELPWAAAMESGNVQSGIPLTLLTPADGMRTFMVNSSPILDDDGVPRGAMATFDDVTELEKKNHEQRDLINALRQSQNEVNRQNEKLQILATRDPLTSCLNRRSFFERCDLEFEIAGRDELPLACIMLDIDHFKSVNDSFGHAVGDEVIKRIVDVARRGLRTIDLIGRYGGEEFCILLPGLDLDGADAVAERLRKSIPAEVNTRATFEAGRVITSSFGVSSTELGAADGHQLVAAADKALYASKNNGRNRVTRIDELDEKQVVMG